MIPYQKTKGAVPITLQGAPSTSTLLPTLISLLEKAYISGRKRNKKSKKAVLKLNYIKKKM